MPNRLALQNFHINLIKHKGLIKHDIVLSYFPSKLGKSRKRGCHSNTRKAMFLIYILVLWFGLECPSKVHVLKVSCPAVEHSRAFRRYGFIEGS
jgi:hypothetical protein